MKKKYLTMLLSLMVIISGFSAWSAMGGVSLLADGDSTELTPALDKCVPAANGAVKGLSYILFTFDENETDIQLNPAFTSKTLGNISTPNPNGTYKPVETITSGNTDRFDHQIDGKEVAANQIVYHLANPITVEEAATYHIAFGGIFVSASGLVNPNIKYDFTIEPESTEPEPLSVNLAECIPAPDTDVYELSYIVLTFGDNDTDIKLNPDYTSTNYGVVRRLSNGQLLGTFAAAKADQYVTYEINGEPLAANQIGFMLDKTFTETSAQNCQVQFFANAFMSGKTGEILGEPIDYNFKLTFRPGDLVPLESSIPANGATVDAPLNQIIFVTPFTMCDKNKKFEGDQRGSIVNVETNQVVETFKSSNFTYKLPEGTTLPDNQFAYILTEPLGAGTYKVSLAARVLKDTREPKDENEAYECTFTVVDEIAPDPITINTAASFPAEGTDVSELSYVILNFGEKETDIKLNPEFTAPSIAYISSVVGGRVNEKFNTADAASILTHEIDGRALADNQIALKLAKPLTTTTNVACRLYIHKEAFVSGTTGGILEHAVEIFFNLTVPKGDIVPITATIPANGSKVEAPVKDIVFTCDPSLKIVYENPTFSGTRGTIVNLSNNQVVDDFSKGQFEFESNGEMLEDNEIAYVLPTPLEAGSYKVSIAEGIFIDEESPYNENGSLEFTFTVVNDLNAPVETFDYGFAYASWGIYDNYDYTYRRVNNDFTTNITFTNLPSGVTLDSSMTPVKWIRESDGTTVDVSLMNFMGMDMLMFTESASWPKDPFGVWTCVLPQGLFILGDSQSVEKTLRLTWVNPNAENPKPEFAVTKVNFFDTPDSFDNLEGQPADAPAPMMYTLWKTVEGGEDMMDWETNPKRIASLNSNKGLVFNTNWDEWIQCFIAEVKRKDGNGEVDVWNQETVQEIYGYGNVCKNYVGASASDCVAYQHPLLGCGGNENTREYENGVVYTFDIWFYDSIMKRSMDSQDHKLAIGKYHFEFTGATMPFEYSEIAKLVSIDPTPANAEELGLGSMAAGEITSFTQPITFTWSAPVTMTAKYSLGNGAGEADLQSCTSNADGTVWTVVPGSEPISNGEGGYLDLFSFNVQAIDADGHYVKGNNGEKENTIFTPEFKFLEIETGIDEAGAIKATVSTVNGAIEICGLTQGTNVSLFAVDGFKIAEKAATDGSVIIPNVVRGTYLIVITAGNGTKETVKFFAK